MATDECLPIPSRWFMCGKPPTSTPASLNRSKSSAAPSATSRSLPPSERDATYSRQLLPAARWREDELKEVFCHFDTNSDGKVSPSELRAFFKSLGEIMSQEDAQAMIDDVDSDGDRMLGFNDFVRLMNMSKLQVAAPGGSGDDDLKKVFEMFEQEKGSGRITARGLQRMLSRLGDSKSFEECGAMIQSYDIDGDGELDFEEFQRMMST